MVSAPVLKPIKRTRLRMKAATALYTGKRYLYWLSKNAQFAKGLSQTLLPHEIFHHETILLRQLKDVDMIWQRNKIVNLRLAVQKLDGIIVHPGQMFSYWKLIGNPTYNKGYLDGVIIRNGAVAQDCGGGLCQLSNLIYWMTLHTPLTVTERHRHGYDVFPDSNRTQPFGSGATCFYPYGDLMIRNDTQQDYQLCVRVGADNLEGEWRSEEQAECRYEIFEKDHHFNAEYWGGFSRHNELGRHIFDQAGQFLRDEFITENHALMMYTPFIEENARL